MLINCVLFAGSFASSLFHPAAPADARVRTPAILTTKVAVADSFSPPHRAKRRRAHPRTWSPPAAVEEDTQPTDDDLEVPAPPPRRESPPPARHREVPALTVDQEKPARGDDDDENDDRPKVKRHATRKTVKAVDEDEDGADENENEDDSGDRDVGFASLPAVVPRLASFGVGASALGRQFQFNTPVQQKEATFPRLGVALSIEAYPLIRFSSGWFNTFGIGASYNLEGGTAALQQGDGSANSFPVAQQRWSVDLRYALPLGERVVVIPAAGYGNSMFDLKRPTSLPPSQCTNASTTPCLVDTVTGFLIADLHLRVAATASFALSLSGGYLVGLGVGKGVGQIGSEAGTTSVTGFHGELAATLIGTDWLALRAAIPLTTYAYKFSGGTATYGSAIETYYGLTLGAVVFTD